MPNEAFTWMHYSQLTGRYLNSNKTQKRIKRYPTCLLALVHRDGPNCHICGLVCNFVERYQVTSGTIEHLHPSSKGGRTEPDNLGIAHNWCNSRKGSEELTDSLREECRQWMMANVGEDRFAEYQEAFDLWAGLPPKGGPPSGAYLKNSLDKLDVSIV